MLVLWSWYNKYCSCSKGGLVDKIVRDPNKTPDSSQRPPIFEKNYPKCGDPVEGLYYRQCALIRKKLEEVFQDFQDTSESSNDNTNVVNTPQEPFVFNQDPGENSSQSPPHIDHNCCYECGDSLDNIFCQRCTCESCGNGAYYGYNCPPKVLIISNPKPCHNQNVDEFPQTLPSLHPTCYSGDGSPFTYDSTPNFVNDSPNVSNPPPQPPTYSYEFCDNDAHYGYDYPPQPSQCRKIPIYYDDDDDEESSIPLRDTIISELPPCIAITPVLYTEEPVDSLIMEDEHLDTISETESDEFIKSSVENLVQNPSESEDFSDIKSECDVPICDNSTTFSNPLFDANDEFSSSDDESFSDEDVPKEIYSNPLFDEEIISDKIDALIISSPKINSLLDQFSGELAHIDLIPLGINEADFDPGEDIRFIERLLYDNSSPRPPEAFQANPNTIIESLPTFPIPVEDSDSLKEEIDIFPGPDIESDDDVVEDIPVDVPNILPTHPILHMDFDFIPSHNDLGFDLNVSSPSGDRNKIYDSGICSEVKSTRFLATHSPVIVRMTKVIKGEFKKIKDIKVKDDSLTCDSPLEVFNCEVSRLSKMDNDLFTYEVEIANIPCDLRVDDDSEHEADDMGFDPSDIAFTKWLGSKGDDEVELTDEEFSDNEDEIADVFRIDTNICDYETPICSAFNEFNYLLKVDEKPWTDTRVWTEPKPVIHICKPFNYKTRCSEWPTCSWMNDGYCNGGNLLGTFIIENQLHYQDYEWYEALEDSELKDEALRNKTIMEGSIKDDDDQSIHEPPVCTIQRFEMIKYSFGQGEEYVAIKEDEYDNLARTSNNECRTYQEIFRMMDEGWMDLVKEILTNIVGEFTNMEILKYSMCQFMSDSEDSTVTYTAGSSPYGGLSDIGSLGVVGPEHEGLPWMLDDPYV
ncbi:hypothetical protein Tco_0318429 [Tanacetum coccineum]